MFIRPREPTSRRRFSSPIRDRARRSTEVYYASFTILVVKIILFFTLIALFVNTIRIFRGKFASAGAFLRFAMPAAVAIFAAVLAFQIYRNIIDLREMNREMRERRKGL